jgi:GntR family transcriptional repressor for pyruvate dehydrogenase complex
MAGTAKIEPLDRLKVADAIAAQLSRMISAGDYESGEKLPAERQLSEQFGVGRSSMREALRSLASEGLVRIEHGIGVFVADPSKRRDGHSGLLVLGDYTVPELFEVRLPLERQAAGLAAERISADELAHLRNVLAEAADPATSDDRFIELDAELHRTIAAASRNPLLVSVVASMEAHFFTYSHQVFTLHDRRSRAHRGHEMIVDALSAGDVTAARHAAVTHIREVEADIVAHLAAHTAEPRTP